VHISPNATKKLLKIYWEFTGIGLHSTPYFAIFSHHLKTGKALINKEKSRKLNGFRDCLFGGNMWESKPQKILYFQGLQGFLLTLY
jgi:hypothetical protein